MSSFKLNDKVRIVGVEYEKNSYDIIIDIIKGNTPYVIDDGCTYKQYELIEYKELEVVCLY